MSATVVGIDCAVDDKKLGLALGQFDGTRMIVREVAQGNAKQKPAELVVDWLRKYPSERALFALDAPLGWPAALGKALVAHQAGGVIEGTPHELFRRATDRFVKNEIGKQSLDVGADRIARTAHAALRQLEDLRIRLSSDIPLAWNSKIAGLAAIEVYPAATLMAHGINASGYKAPASVSCRARVMTDVATRIELARGVHPDISRGSDALDAVICLLAAQDFLSGAAHPPEDHELAKKEGWIWVKMSSPI